MLIFIVFSNLFASLCLPGSLRKRWGTLGNRERKLQDPEEDSPRTQVPKQTSKGKFSLHLREEADADAEDVSDRVYTNPGTDEVRTSQNPKGIDN